MALALKLFWQMYPLCSFIGVCLIFHTKNTANSLHINKYFKAVPKYSRSKFIRISKYNIQINICSICTLPVTYFNNRPTLCWEIRHLQENRRTSVTTKVKDIFNMLFCCRLGIWCILRICQDSTQYSRAIMAKRVPFKIYSHVIITTFHFCNQFIASYITAHIYLIR